MNIVGKWVVDPSDTPAVAEFGEVSMEFTTDGKLIYCVDDEKNVKVAFLKYWVEGRFIWTDQPSAPRREGTPFRIDQMASGLNLR